MSMSTHPERGCRWDIRTSAFGLVVGVLLIVGGVAVVPGGPLASLVQGTPLGEVPRAGNPMLHFALSTATGETLATSQFVDKVLLINFWATWCVPCRQEMPALQKVYDTHRRHGLALLGVNYGEGTERVVNYTRELGITFPVVLDRDSTIGELYRVQGLPTTIFVDRHGNIRDMVLGGPMSESYIESKILPLLDER